MKTLLHVDDDSSWRFNFEDIAETLGLNLEQFSSRDEALEAIRKAKPDFVITDLHLGDDDQSGYEIARTAKEAGVLRITIASSTGTPSQQIEGVTIQSKDEAINWLKRLVRGGPEGE